MPHPTPRDAEVIAFIALSDSHYPPDATNLSIADNRRLYESFALAMRGEAPANVAWADFAVEAEEPRRSIAARRYQRQAPAGRVIVLYLHGGGYVLGGLESHHDICLGLCEATGLDIVAIEYRLAPEHTHPAQSDDCEVAYRALVADGRPIVVAGDSAGANLAAGLGLRARDRGFRSPAAQVLIYPGLGGDRNEGSHVENAEAPMLTRADSLAYGLAHAGRLGEAALRDPDFAPLAAASFAGLPPAFVVSADIDPLRDDARIYVEKLTAAGVPATWRNEPELVHGFLRARRMSRRAAASFAAIAGAIRAFADAASR